MGGLPDLVIVIDTIREAIAVKEAMKLGIPVVAVVDSNSDPDGITYPVPGNDDATKAIELYCNLFASAVLEGLRSGMERSGIDIGTTDAVLDDGIVVADERQEATAAPTQLSVDSVDAVAQTPA
jgi:small subunit ribosomal protein S2